MRRGTFQDKIEAAQRKIERAIDAIQDLRWKLDSVDASPSEKEDCGRHLACVSDNLHKSMHESISAIHEFND